ncbi:MAG: nuclear transport factor 2 family protein [Ignavibacteriales bacterium]|nr:MAG: nuclear transport factor 2 family protein [Ignavibacteriales bacterium]
MKQLVVVVVLFLVCAGSSIAQEWSSQQKEVWAGVEKYWEVNQNNPMDFLQYFDESYLGWGYENEHPSTKNDAAKSFGYWTKKGKEQYHVLTPSKIWVNGNFAFVHYYYTQVMENSNGQPRTERGRWTDILMKKGDKWMLVGDHGGEIKNSD